MTITEAKNILLAWRPGHGDLRDPDVAAALELARHDPELKSWLDRHGDFQRAVARGFHEIPVPADLRARILARPKVVALVAWWQKPAWWSAAAALVLLLGLAGWWFRPLPDSLAVFRSRMVGIVLRQYTMELATNDLTQVRAYLARKQAPSDFVLPEKLGRLPLLGADALSWRTERVSMVCLESPTKETLFLFVVNDASLGRELASRREFIPVSDLMTASWTQGGRTYVLAGSVSRAALEQYF